MATRDREWSTGAPGVDADADASPPSWSRRASSRVTTTTTGDSRHHDDDDDAVATHRRRASSTPPTVALTVGLTRTYQGINARYYEVRGRAVFARRARSSRRRRRRCEVWVSTILPRADDSDVMCCARTTHSGWSLDGVYRRKMRDMDEEEGMG